jgi:hypothetical protein
MSNEISYIFVAIDKFTKVADNIARSIENINNKIKKGGTPLKDHFSKNTNEVNKNLEVLKEFTRLNMVTIKTSDKLSKKINRSSSMFSSLRRSIYKLSKPFKIFNRDYDRWADTLGMNAYFKSMNIVFPMMIVAKLGMQYAKAMDSASISMGSLFGNIKGASKYHTILSDQAINLRKISGFSTSDIIASQSIIARALGNIKETPTLTSNILKVLASQGVTENVPQAVSGILSGILSGHVEGIQTAFTAPTGVQRVQQFNKFVSSHKGIYDKALSLRLKTVTVQASITKSSLSKLFGVIMMSGTTAFERLNNLLDKILPKIERFISTHKGFSTTIIEFGFFITTLLSSLMGVGAIVGAISLITGMLGSTLTMILAVSSGIYALITMLKNMPKIMTSIENAVKRPIDSVIEKFDKLRQVVSMPIDIRHPIDSFKRDWNKADNAQEYYDKSHDMVGTMLMRLGGLKPQTDNVVNVHVHNKGNISSHVISDSPSNSKLNVEHSSRNFSYG